MDRGSPVAQREDTAMTITHLNANPGNHGIDAFTHPDGVRLPAATLAEAELDGWDDAIVDLNLALTDAAVSRDKLGELSRLLELEEARETLGATGPNAEARRAAVLLTLHESVPAYQALLAQQREQRLRLADSERRSEIARQRCRLLHAAIRLAQPEA